MIKSSDTTERTEQFPNLLADKDFTRYYWTLPFCNL